MTRMPSRATPTGQCTSDALPAACARWRKSRLGQITDRLEERLILKLVTPVNGQHILDAGCGDGVPLLDTALTPVLFLRYGRKPLERLIEQARTRAEDSRAAQAPGRAAEAF